MMEANFQLCWDSKTFLDFFLFENSVHSEFIQLLPKHAFFLLIISIKEKSFNFNLMLFDPIVEKMCIVTI